MATADPIRDRKELSMLADYFLSKNKYRDYALFVLGIYTTLRISDLLGLKWSHIYDEANDRFNNYLIIYESKTSKEKKIALNKKCVEALHLLYPHRCDAFVFSNYRKNSKAIDRCTAYRIITRAARKLGIEGVICCHSMRKTLGYHAWVQGESPVILMEMYNHSSYKTTKRYLGVLQSDIDNVYTNVKLL